MNTGLLTPRPSISSFKSINIVNLYVNIAIMKFSIIIAEIIELPKRSIIRQ